MMWLKSLITLALFCITPSLAGKVNDPKAQLGCGFHKNLKLDEEDELSVGEAHIGEFPWTMSIEVVKKSLFTSGALIHPKVVIAVAHYHEKIKPEDLIVYAGVWKHEKSMAQYPVQSRSVEKMILHNKYNATKPFDYNGALLILSEPFELADHINTICLPDSDKSFENTNNCIGSTWVLFKNRKIKTIQNKNRIKIISEKECISKMEDAGLEADLSPPTICGVYTEGTDICAVMFSSPLGCPREDGGFELAGIHSWDVSENRCMLRNSVSGFVEISKIRSWIDEELKKSGLEL